MDKTFMTIEYPPRREVKVRVNLVGKCPRCHTSFNGEIVSSHLFSEDKLYKRLYVLHYCSACEQAFIGTYLASYPFFENYIPTERWPSTPEPQSHDSSVANLSKSYVEIYAQAWQAEQYNLTKLCGMGYRKALEFLVKDYAIYRVPGDAETIKTLPLAKCIDKYIDSPRIKSLAQRSAWLGNDETHYVRDHPDRSYLDIKKFLHAIETFISADLAVDDAESIPHK